MRAKQQTMKRYYHTQLKDFILPDDFVFSRNKKFIVVQYFGAVVNKSIVCDLMVHWDIVEFNLYNNEIEPEAFVMSLLLIY